jgi:hypothetical protein
MVSLLFVMIPAFLIAQKSSSHIEVVKKINEDFLKKHVFELASDEMEGRETGTPGIDKAANYIADQLVQFGIKPLKETGDYFQPTPFHSANWDQITVEIDGKEYSHLKDYMSTPDMNSNLKLEGISEVIYLGYGIDDTYYSDYKRNIVSGNTIMIYRGTPAFFSKEQRREWTIFKKLKVAKDMGVKNVLLIDDNISITISRNRSSILNRSLKPDENLDKIFSNSLLISNDMAEEIMGDRKGKIKKKKKRSDVHGKSGQVKLKSNLNITQLVYEKKISSNNVLAFIEGNDPELKDEIVLLTAHYDHLGKRGDDIFNGADDNASGSAALLAIANALSYSKRLAYGPARSVLIMWVTAEEKGLLGSDYYAEHPVFPLENTMVDINVDMIGRSDTKHSDNPNYIYVIGADQISQDLHDINESVNKTYSSLELDYTFNDENDPNRFYYRSDHYNFAKRGIPSVFFFSGIHADYHRPSDTFDKLDFQKMEKITRHIFHLTWELANRKNGLKIKGQ